MKLHTFVAIILLALEVAGNPPNFMPPKENGRQMKERELLNAVINGDESKVQHLIHQMDVNVQLEGDQSAIHIAARMGNLNIVRLLLDNRVSVNFKTASNQKTPLHFACETGRKDVVWTLIIDYHAEIDCKDNDGMTSLHYAAKSGYVTIAKLLIEKHADIDAKNNFHETPLHLSAYYGYSDVVRILVEHKADGYALSKDKKNTTTTSNFARL